MADEKRPSAARDTASNPFPEPAPVENFESILNLLAVAVAQGSGDPQVKNQVLQDLAGKRHAREQAVQRRRDFEADLSLIDARTAAEAESQKMAEERRAATPAGRVEAKLAEEELSPAGETLRLAKKQADVRGAVAQAETAETALKYAKEDRPIDQQLKKLGLDIDRLKLQEQQAQTNLASDPESIENQKELMRLKVEREKAEITKVRAEAEAKGGGRMSRPEATRINFQDYRAITRTAAENAVAIENILTANNMPSWLSLIPSKKDVKNDAGEVTKQNVVGVVPGYMSEARKVEVMTILEDVGERISSHEMHVTTNEQLAYKKALNDIMVADPTAIDRVLNDLQQQFYEAAGFTEDVANDENMALAERAMHDFLRIYEVDSQIINRINFSSVPTGKSIPAQGAEPDTSGANEPAVEPRTLAPESGEVPPWER